MKLSTIKTILPTLTALHFQLPDGSIVPSHFHVTEVGIINKNFIDCGGTIRSEQKVNFQLWSANDVHHQLQPQKLLDIIELSEKALDMADAEIEVEYQSTTIGKYALAFNGTHFQLINLHTACLAEEQCGITPAKTLATAPAINACTPGGGCC
ncbi:DUF6428 family protein [Ferruginibacter yonginensis]|uniref:DUF6428 family protein n=1 Tax=Ferruginibacter yonginensis TaxID=1310416 RepID=A0ABV8QT85_9BACT